MKFKVLIITLLSVFVLLLAAQWNVLEAQCPMCKMSAESNLKEGGTMARGLNTGILYMLAMPYLIVASIGLWWYKNRKKEQEVQQVSTDLS